MKTLKTIAIACTLAALTGCDRTSGGLVASAGSHRLTVDETARLLSGVEDLPNEPEVVQALAELWIDYTLLAEAVARDSSLAQLDLAPLLDQAFEQDMVLALRDSVVQPDTTVTEEELRDLFERETPGARVRARHILMGYPQDAAQPQRDSVRAEMEAILQQVQSGADFATLARERSHDTGSASQGGDLGWFERGDMVRPFEEVAFALEPGETSGIVETPFGFHIIRVEDKEVPGFEDVRGEFRTRLQQERFQRAESTYIASVEQDADIRVSEGAADLVRDLATSVEQRLSSRAANRTLAEYDGGEFTVREAQIFLRTRQPQFRQGLREAPDEAIEDNFLRGLVQRELLVARAREAGLGPDQEARDSVADLYRDRFRSVAADLGLHPLETRGSETREQAIDRLVEERLRAILSGVSQVLPLTGVSLVLRNEYDAAYYATGAQAALAEIERIRGPGAVPGATPEQPVPTSPQDDPPLPPPDTGSGS